MILGFLAVEGKRDVDALFRQGNDDPGYQRYTFIGWAEQHVKADVRPKNGFRVELGELPQRLPIIE